MPLGMYLLWSFIQQIDRSIKGKQSVQKLDGQGAMAGIKASRFLTLELLWTGRGCPESGRFVCSGRSGGVQSESNFEGKD